MGGGYSQDIKPKDVAACSPTAMKAGFWIRPNGVNMSCYEGDVCSNGRWRTLEGLAVDWGGPGNCLSAGFEDYESTESRFGRTGVWYSS
jgi:hypothetical protein|eukprot:CAMPEP_0174357838 /NCGR_PEP_ID=MMETSP0811_2-20130205/37929_1 /TAXON_ID=73025 ORGANISM="Eutreptiella gymnastica-like, Strain CCMP1594" /NCGR_SAMPLE_ID=MMETSP0811_2 /ASSEMBLY_ACC=CAM_ASM_000667 /LENGTH=88 /DNA_ID=CAMNT_0015490971 /DNA_START=25 /DNA_END=291 /DNA_ORIENTATION=+